MNLDFRSEDGIIALTWRHFLDYPDQPEWLLRFPMVKASLRCMDMVSEFAQKELGYPEINRWGVTGASKVSLKMLLIWKFYDYV